jgi:type II secretory pathway pseudopilin PulG
MRGGTARGYAMAALLVAMSVMAVMMTVAMPVWKQMAQREKEEELIFRGQQYARAIGLFQRKSANAMPPNVDVLVEQRFLRKKYKDPVTNDDFEPLTLTSQAGRGATPGGGSQTAARPGQPATGPATPAVASTPSPGPPSLAGVIGVVSKSREQSIRTYKGRTHYNEWTFIFLVPSPAPGTTGGVPGAPGARGARGGELPRGRGRATGAPNSPNGRGSPSPGGRGFTPGPGTSRGAGRY